MGCHRGSGIMGLGQGDVQPCMPARLTPGTEYRHQCGPDGDRPKGSVLLRLRCTISTHGFSRESMLMSDADSIGSEFCWGDCSVNSPARMNPKNPRQQAAQSKALSNVQGPRDQIACILLRRSSVIGSLFPRVWAGVTFRIPLSIYDSLGREVNAGSGRPALIWWYWRPLRYD